jgi:hypothetical protein
MHLPSITENYAAGRDAILSKVKELASSLAHEQRE